MSKHRKMKSRTKKFAAVTATSATAAALTAGAAVQADKPVTWADILLTAGPNYTQLIEDWSNSYDNILLAQYNINSAGASLWNPLASATGGLLPTFSNDYDHNDLATIPGILAALADALGDGTDLSVVPGLPADATTTVLGGLLAGLLPIPGLGTALGGAVARRPRQPRSAVASLRLCLDDLSGIPAHRRSTHARPTYSASQLPRRRTKTDSHGRFSVRAGRPHSAIRSSNCRSLTGSRAGKQILSSLTRGWRSDQCSLEPVPALERRRHSGP